MTDASHEAALQALMADLVNQVKEGMGDFISSLSTIERCDIEGAFDFRRAIAAYEAAQRRPVEKVRGYQWPGVVVADFRTLAGERRLVVECTVPEIAGALHIYSPEQIRDRPITPPPEDKG